METQVDDQGFLAVKPRPIYRDRNFWWGVGCGALGCVVVFVLISQQLYQKYAREAKQLLAVPLYPGVQEADYDWEVIDLKGNKKPISAFKGQVLFLNFLATRHPLSQAEMPTIQRLSDKMNGRVAFACVAWEEPEALASFMDQSHATLPVYRLKGALPKVFQAGGVPSTFILDRNGRIAFRQVGGARWDGTETVSFLERLLGPGSVDGADDP
jgi:thiol-disulfide isomerase/thioredoxin